MWTFRGTPARFHRRPAPRDRQGPRPGCSRCARGPAGARRGVSRMAATMAMTWQALQSARAATPCPPSARAGRRPGRPRRGGRQRSDRRGGCESILAQISLTSTLPMARLLRMLPSQMAEDTARAAPRRPAARGSWRALCSPASSCSRSSDARSFRRTEPRSSPSRGGSSSPAVQAACFRPRTSCPFLRCIPVTGCFLISASAVPGRGWPMRHWLGAPASTAPWPSRGPWERSSAL